MGKQSFGRGAENGEETRAENGEETPLAALQPKPLTRAKTIPPATQVSGAKI